MPESPTIATIGELTNAELRGTRQQIVSVATDAVQTHPRNARRGNVGKIRASLDRWGQYQPIVVQASTGFVIAGNHRLLAARDLGWTEIDAIMLDVSDDEARRILLIDNKSSDDASYDEQGLAELLRDLQGDFDGTGWAEDELHELLEEMGGELDPGELPGEDGEGEPGAAAGDLDGEDGEDDRGSLLELADVTVDEPKHQPEHGSRWRLGEHLLVIAKLADEHHLWRDELEGRQFAPYPEPYITVSTLAQNVPLLLVQPNTYLAGHLLDKHEGFYPGSIEQLA